MKKNKNNLKVLQQSIPGDAKKNLPKAEKKDSGGIFAGGIAHDLNTILTVIYGYGELALEGLEPDSENFANIKKIIQSADRARDLTRQLLNYGMETEQIRMKVPVMDILRETIDFLRPAVTGRIIFTEEMLTPGVRVSADPTQLFRVFINLANNAIQAMEEKGGTLSVTLDTRKGAEIRNFLAGRQPAEEYALIRFADTGPGMDKATAGRIFKPYDTPDRHGNGRGLGLSVVSGIISGIDGEITVTSEKGIGTVIDVLIPVVPSTVS